MIQILSSKISLTVESKIINKPGKEENTILANKYNTFSLASM
jgi:hypothetical protein